MKRYFIILLLFSISMRAFSNNDNVNIFHNMNIITMINESEKFISFKSDNGYIRYEKETKSFNLVPKDSITFNYTKPNLRTIYKQLPAGINLRHTYNEIKFISENQGEKLFLVSSAGEGATFHTQYLINSNSDKFYRLKYDTYRSVISTNNIYWLERKYGFSAINKKSLEITDYLILPFIDKNSTFNKYEDKILVANDNFGFQLFSKNSTNFNYWTISELFINKSEKLGIELNPKIEYYFESCIFSNFQQNSDKIWITCYFQDHKSYILTFSKKNETWEIDKLTGVLASSHIYNDDQKLWIGCNHTDVFEGGTWVPYGGLFIYGISTKTIEKPNPKINNFDLLKNQIVNINKIDDIVSFESLANYTGETVNLTKFLYNLKTSEFKLISDDYIVGNRAPRIYYEKSKVSKDKIDLDNEYDLCLDYIVKPKIIKLNSLKKVLDCISY